MMRTSLAGSEARARAGIHRVWLGLALLLSGAVGCGDAPVAPAPGGGSPAGAGGAGTGAIQQVDPAGATAQLPLGGRITVSEATNVQGYAFDPAAPDEALEVALSQDGVEVARTKADRNDVRGMPSPGHGFNFDRINLRSGASVSVEARSRSGRARVIATAVLTGPNLPSGLDGRPVPLEISNHVRITDPSASDVAPEQFPADPGVPPGAFDGPPGLFIDGSVSIGGNLKGTPFESLIPGLTDSPVGLSGSLSFTGRIGPDLGSLEGPPHKDGHFGATFPDAGHIETFVDDFGPIPGPGGFVTYAPPRVEIEDDRSPAEIYAGTATEPSSPTGTYDPDGYEPSIRAYGYPVPPEVAPVTGPASGPAPKKVAKPAPRPKQPNALGGNLRGGLAAGTRGNVGANRGALSRGAGGSLGSALGTLVKNAAGGVTKIIKGVAAKGGGLVKQAVKVAGKVVKAAQPVIKQGVKLATNVLKGVQPIVKEATKVAQQTVKAVQPVIKEATKVAAKVAKDVKPLVKDVTSIAGKIAKDASKSFADIGNAFKGFRF